MLAPWKKSYDKPRQHIKKQRHHFIVFLVVICMDVKVGSLRKLSAKELMLLNCGVEEDCSESLGQQGDPASPS